MLCEHTRTRYELGTQVNYSAALPAVLNQARDVRETRYRHWLFAEKH